MGGSNSPGRRIPPRLSGRILAAAPLFLVFCSACSTPAASDGDASPNALRLFKEANRAAAEGRLQDAESGYRLAIDRSRGFVDAHRALQDLLEFTCRGHEAVVTYRREVERNPEDPRFLYLAGRMESDPERQASLFRRAWGRDTDGFWPNLAMGFVLYKDRSFSTALRFFQRAARARPREALVWRHIAETRVALRRFDGALEALARAARIDPDDFSLPLRSAQVLLFTGRRDEAFLLLLAILEAEADPGRATRALLRRILRDEPDLGRCRRVWAVEKSNLDAHPSNPAVLAFSGFLRLELGDPGGAESLLVRALERGAPPSRAALDLRRARFCTGRYGEAYSAWRAKASSAPWESADNEAGPRFRAVARCIEVLEKNGDDPVRLLALGLALSRCGWVREAVPVLRRSAKGGKGEAPLALSRALAHIEFLRRLRIFLDGAYVEYLEERDAGDLDALLDGISGLSLEVLGEDLGKGNAVRRFFLVGEIVAADPTTSPLVRYFDEFNKFLVLGRKSGGTPEAVLMNIVYRNRSARFPHGGDPVSCDIAVGEDFELESFGEYIGGALLGVSLLGRFYVNLDEVVDRDFEDWAALRDAVERRDRLAAFGSWTAETRREACALDAGAGLSSLLVMAAFPECRPGEPVRGTAYPGVVDHELMHVKDANRFLPIGSHPFAALGLGIRHGFSQVSIESEMEERAALAALVLSERPHLELRHILSFAPYPESALPHSRGFCRLLKRLLEHLWDRPEEYPSLDRGRNLCRQLHRLSREELLKAAECLARESGIVE